MLYREKGLTSSKKEGDNKTPKGIFKIGNLYFRKDKLKKPDTQLTCLEIKDTMDGVMTLISQKI